MLERRKIMKVLLARKNEGKQAWNLATVLKTSPVAEHHIRQESCGHNRGSDFQTERLVDGGSVAATLFLLPMSISNGVSSVAHGWLRMNGAELVGVDQELLPIGHADLVKNVGQMMAHRAVTNGQLMSDFFVGQPSLHQSGHLSFALG
jgi:hypothetical protein